MKANNPDASLKKEMTHFEPASEGTRGGKTNGETATLRSGNLPKSEAVRTVGDSNKGAAVKAAKRQNMNDEDSGSLTVIPNCRIPAPPDTHGSEK